MWSIQISHLMSLIIKMVYLTKMKWNEMKEKKKEKKRNQISEWINNWNLITYCIRTWIPWNWNWIWCFFFNNWNWNINFTSIYSVYDFKLLFFFRKTKTKQKTKWLNKIEFKPSSVQKNPSPKYPSLHWQLKLPGVFVHIASEWQLSVFKSHSSISIFIKFWVWIK